MATYRQLNPDFYKADINPADKNRMAIEAGYSGTEDALNNANKERQGGGGTNASIGSSAGGVGGMGALTFTQPTLDLNSLYANLTKESGIKDIEGKISAQEQGYNAAMSKINDNPFLAESNRVGRGQKLTQDYTAAGANLRNDLATKKADIETRLNIATKQFDINSKQASDAFNQFQSLLSTGALDNATADDIANITRATGISSGMVQSAINAAKQAKVQDVKTEMIKYDDGTNQGYLIVNSQTGEIIKKDTIAPSEPKKGTKATETEMKESRIQTAKEAAQKGATLSQMFSLFGGILDPNLIYQIYNANSKYGPDTGKISNLKKYGVTQ